MTSEPALAAALVCHPVSSSAGVRAVTVHVDATPGGGLRLAFRLDADLDRLHIAPPAATARADRLWEHTCFEAFLAGAAGQGYREFNFSPSGAWAAYDFDGYRRNMRPADARHPAIRVRRDASILELESTLDATCLPAGSLRLALSAVIEDRDGTRSYWALRHPAGEPDFHHPDSFVLLFDRVGPRPVESRG